ncbi:MULTISPECIES: aminoglycoside N(3)-acetyltransferase [unclassified Crossiella]|uniref:aminoglycoside N(3)-acetyltransferase n=1 Tax=unclassified Crossiella TaxID=2620835 RepID=UPI001FFEF1DF|nr:MULTISPECIES: AAC(3) family N-acetyltransferase [unclassified Crossiella]MCK2240112.1 AAC(3) family N-acetyltransferase [Crossiella sp. S99.2]MCK2253436.1 AAC(3) family N-acetyltransferase [Crossiella sp. S99.1]
MTVIAHAALSSLGQVPGGAATVVASLRQALGSTGTLVGPAFTPQVADPAPQAGVPDARTRDQRAAVPLFHPGLPSPMGAVAEAIRTCPGALRSGHPQASVAAVGARAADIVQHQPLSFALSADSPFGRLYDLDARILLIGVGHDRNSFLHHVETRTPAPRLKLRRFPLLVDGERVWCEALDVADDHGRFFPTLGAEFEQQHGIRPFRAGSAQCRLLPARALVDFAVPRLTALLAA